MPQGACKTTRYFYFAATPLHLTFTCLPLHTPQAKLYANLSVVTHPPPAPKCLVLTGVHGHSLGGFSLREREESWGSAWSHIHSTETGNCFYSNGVRWLTLLWVLLEAFYRHRGFCLIPVMDRYGVWLAFSIKQHKTATKKNTHRHTERERAALFLVRLNSLFSQCNHVFFLKKLSSDLFFKNDTLQDLISLPFSWS